MKNLNKIEREKKYDEYYIVHLKGIYRDIMQIYLRHAIFFEKRAKK